MSFDRIEHSFTLNWVSARVIIQFAVNKKYRSFDLVSMHEWAHVIVQIGSLPVSTVFILKSKWCKGTIIGTAARNTRFEKFCMSQEIRCHECSITMSANCHPIPVAHTHF